VRGGAPGTVETDLLRPDELVTTVNAILLSGGSAWGLAARDGVMKYLEEHKIGFSFGHQYVPIVPGAILFDLLNGGDKNWTDNPYRTLGEQALTKASEDFALGTAGAGVGALTANLKGGLGSASLVLESGFTVGALVGANPTGSVTVGDRSNFWAAPFEMDGEFGGVGPFAGPVAYADTTRTKRDGTRALSNTTIAIVATDAILTKAQAKRFAVAAQDGMARAVSPSHTPVDGDLIFAISTGTRSIDDPIRDPIQLGHAAAVCVARAIARAIYLATPTPGDTLPTWWEKWGRG
jgi:D-aminopeptidase